MTKKKITLCLVLKLLWKPLMLVFMQEECLVKLKN